MRVTTAGLVAAFTAFAVAAGFDWVWELTAVGVLGVIALALLTGPATAVYEPLRVVSPGESPRWTTRKRVTLGLLTGLTAWVADLRAGRSAARRSGDRA